MDHPLIPIGPIPRTLLDLRVSDLKLPNSNMWDWTRIREYLPQYEDQIRLLPISSSRRTDVLTWLPVKRGKYTTRSGYAASTLREVPQADRDFKWQTHIWRAKALPKIKHLLWKMCKNALPTGQSLFRRGIVPSPDCPRCGAPETVLHVIRDCPFAAQVWDSAPLSTWDRSPHLTMYELIANAKQGKNLPPSGTTTPLFPWLIWNIWTARNQLIYEDRHFSHWDVISKASVEARAWSAAQGPQGCSAPRTDTIRTSPTGPSVQPNRRYSCHVDAAWHADS